MADPLRITCPGCLQAMRLSRATGGTFWPCPVHDHELAAEPVRETPRVLSVPVPPVPQPAPAAHSPRKRKPHSNDPDAQRKLVRRFVYEVLEWSLSIARVESAVAKGRSNIASVLEALELQILGTGCRGTKGVGAAPREERAVRAHDPERDEQYRRLPREHQVIADAVIADGQGDQDAPLDVDCVHLEKTTLAQRIGYRMAPADQRAKWERKVIVRDAAPSLAGMSDLGERLLIEAARAWLDAKT